MENRSETEDLYYGNVGMNLYPERNVSLPPAPQRITADNSLGLCQKHCTELILMKWLFVSTKLNTTLWAKIFLIVQRQGSQFPLIFNTQAIICFHFLIALISHFVGKLALSQILKNPSMITNNSEVKADDLFPCPKKYYMADECCFLWWFLLFF